MLYNRKFSLPRLACARLIRKVSDASTSILQHHKPLQRWNTKISAMYLTTQRVPEQQLLFLTSCSLVTSVVNEFWLLQTKDLIVTQNDLEAILKPWQSKLCFIVFFFSFSGCENTQINTLQHENSTVKFSFVTNSNKKAPSMPCHFQFRRKCTNKLLPLGHLWQWAILCQLLLKAIHISGPKISFKIIIFCILVAGCQL